MAEEKFKVTIKGPGLSFDQSVDKAGANQIMSFVMTGSTLANPGGGGGSGGDSGAGAGAAGGAARANLSGLNPKQFLAKKNQRPNTSGSPASAIFCTPRGTPRSLAPRR